MTDPRRLPENQPPPSLRKELVIDAICGAQDSITKLHVLGSYMKYGGQGGFEVDREALGGLTFNELMDLYSRLKAEEVRRDRGY